jgi:hypothetical protein
MPVSYIHQDIQQDDFRPSKFHLNVAAIDSSKFDASRNSPPSQYDQPSSTRFALRSQLNATGLQERQLLEQSGTPAYDFGLNSERG